ncbi:MAG TPA: DUF1206 domain-containing protein [Bryobacteraceae bacterium]|nr:DUF1206 domain-containing protein [Bryobacteraceae bacterium]
MSALAGTVERSPWLQAWARLGFAVGGIVYVIIAVIAILVATAHYGPVPGPEGALAYIGTQPFGHILLAVVTIGLFGYAAWCLVQAFLDTDHDGADLKGITIRIGELCSGAAYIGLAVLALHVWEGRPSHGSSPAHWTAKLLAHPWGTAIVALGGITFAIVGVCLLVYGMREKFRKYLRLPLSSGSDWIIRFGKWGYSAQGIVFCIIGGFLFSAGVHSNPREVRGLDGALQWLAQQSYGPWILGVVAAGLGAYGLFMLVEARYRYLT